MARIQLRAFTNVLRDQMEEQVYLLGQELLAHVSTDYNLDHKELVEKYLGPPPRPGAIITDGKNQPAPVLVAAQQEKQKRQRKKPDKVMCKGITAKGQPCKFGACGEEGLCKKHLQSQEKDPQAPRKTTKVQKPRHEHLVEDDPETCQVCETHGNVINPEMPREEFEIKGADEIKERLQRILREAEGEVPEDTPEEVTDMVSTQELLGETHIREEMVNEDNTPCGSDNEEEDDDLQARLKVILSEEDADEDDE